MESRNTRIGNAPTVEVRPARLPRAWPSSAVFFANIDCIFYGDPDKTRHLRENVSGFPGYGARMLPILGLIHGGTDNLLLMPKAPNPALLTYFRDTLSLPVPKTLSLDDYGVQTHSVNETASGSFVRMLRTHPAGRIDGYVTDPQLEALARRVDKPLVNSHAASRGANDKVNLFRFLAETGLPVFDGSEAEAGADLSDDLDRLRRLGYGKAILRSALGASGFGMKIVDLENPESQDTTPFFRRGEPLLVHGWIEEGRQGIEALLSPSVQFFCHKEDSATIFDITQQYLSHESIHEGNISPPPGFAVKPGDEIYDRLIQQSREVIRWVAVTGYLGTGSIDFLIYRIEGNLQVRVCEVNARVTGATYPSMLARHFGPERAWLMRNFRFGSCLDVGETFELIKRKHLLFRPGDDAGVLPINFITNPEGQVTKAQLLFLGETPSECMRQTEAFVRAMPPRCVYDRD